MKWFNGYKMRLVLIGFVAAIALVGGGSASAELTWTQKADMPTPRWAQSSAVVNGKIYVIGGGTSEPDSILLSTVEEYDPVTNTWTRKADMPTARGWISPSSAEVDGKIYVIGGWGGQTLSTVEEYDPVTDTWTRKTDMPTPREGLATVAVDRKIYAIGGLPDDVYEGLSTVEEYDPVTDTWTRKTNMPTGVWGASASAVDDKIYVVGGADHMSADPFMQLYDPQTDTWTKKADMLISTRQMASAVLGDKIIVIGGWRGSGKFPYTTVQMYDPETDIWTREADVPFLRAAVSAGVVNNRIYVIGGTDRPHPCPATSTVYEFGAPPPDFNGDGIVDVRDVVIMTQHWGENYPLCDIGPSPFGDGIVDVRDLVVLAAYIEPIEPEVRALAHWALDESEGIVAYDSSGDNNADIFGDPVWQPTGGMVDGTIQLDGVDDYIRTPFILDPAKDSLSVFAWIKGGAPGQVIISQTGGFGGTWLGTNSSEGKLMTGLSDIYFGALESESVITDGQWHHVGLVYDLDALHRHLYVDGVEVTVDSDYVAGVPSDGGLYIGAGKDLEPGSLFGGLIDDVRIYDAALTAEEIERLAN